MKKLIAMLLALTILLSLTACDALSKLKGGGKDPDPVEAKEPEIPGTSAPSGNDTPPVQEYDPTMDKDPTGPAESDPGPGETPAGGEDGGNDPDMTVTASHSDVTLFSAGETFTMSARGVSGTYACSYTSKDAAVAEVDGKTGVVTAVAPGMTTVSMHVECEAGQFDFDCIIRCRWEADEPSLPEDPAGGGTSQTSAPSLSGFFATLQGKYDGLGMMMVLDSALLENYYPGLSGIAAVEEILIYESAISINNKAVGLVRLSDSATTQDILAVQSVLQSRISAQAGGGAFYPDACDTWENGVITSVSNCVGMFVYPDDAHSMATLFTDTFGS